MHPVGYQRCVRLDLGYLRKPCRRVADYIAGRLAAADLFNEVGIARFVTAVLEAESGG